MSFFERFLARLGSLRLFHRGSVRAVGVDLAFRRNASALVCARAYDRRLVFDAAHEWLPTPHRPLVPSEVCRDVVSCTSRYGADTVVSDVHYRDTLLEHTSSAGLGLVNAPASSDDIADAYTMLRILLRERLVTIEPSAKVLAEQLSDVTITYTHGGLMQVHQGATAGGRHGDVVSAAIACVWGLRHELRGWTGRPVSMPSRVDVASTDDDECFDVPNVIGSRPRVLF